MRFISALFVFLFYLNGYAQLKMDITKLNISQLIRGASSREEVMVGDSLITYLKSTEGDEPTPYIEATIRIINESDSAITLYPSESRLLAICNLDSKPYKTEMYFMIPDSDKWKRWNDGLTLYSQEEVVLESSGYIFGYGSVLSLKTKTVSTILCKWKTTG